MKATVYIVSHGDVLGRRMMPDDRELDLRS
jgi:hypothetical protein